MTPPRFLERDVVVFLHDQALRAYGGRHGLRDEGLLDSALFRPVARLDFGETPDLYELAASYAYGLAANHPFVDGNKRTAWSCAVLFLKANLIDVRPAPADVVLRMLDLVERRCSEAAFADWLREQPVTHT